MNRTKDTKGATQNQVINPLKYKKHLITYEPDQQIGDEHFKRLHLCLFFFVPLEKSTQPSLSHTQI